MPITIPQNDRIISYTATGGQTTFAYDFQIANTNELAVIQYIAGVATLLTLTTHYTVSGAGTQPGGNVTLVTGATVGDIVTIYGDLAEARSTNFTAAGDFTANAINTELNALTEITQQLRRDVDRSVHMSPGDPTDVSAVTMTFPVVADRASKYLSFDATGQVRVSPAVGVAGPIASAENEVALFTGTDGQEIKRPGTGYMILPQGTTAQEGTPSAIALRGNTDGGGDMQVYVGGTWVSVLSGVTGAPISASYITRTAEGVLTGEFAMASLATGIVKNTTTTGTPSIAVEGTDYYGPAGTDIPVTDGGTGASTAADARTNLGLAIGTNVQAYDATLQSIAALGTAADKFAYTTGIDTWAEADITAAGRAILDDANAAAQLTTLGAQPVDAGLTDIAALAVTDGNFIVGDGVNWIAESGATARTSLGLNSMATQSAGAVAITGGSVTGITDITVADGGTGRSTHTAYAVLCGGTTTTAAQQSIASVGTANQVLKSNGAGALPTFQDNAYDVALVAGYGQTMVKENVAVQTYGEFVMARTGSITGEAAYADTAPTGAALILDVLKNGVTVYTTKPQFAATSQALTAGTLKTDGTEDFVSGDRITFSITQIGSTEPGEGIRFTLKCSV